MKVDLKNQWRAYVRGAAQVACKNDWLAFHRMSAELSEFYAYSEPASVRARCAAGIKISMVTDTDTLAMEVRFGEFSRPIFSVDVLVDGAPPLSVGNETQPHAEFLCEWRNLGTHRKRIDILLPHCAEIFARELRVSEGASVEPAPDKARTWLQIGDSITQGMTASSPARIYANVASENLNADAHNIAVGGATMRGELGELAGALAWDFATVAFGINDYGQSRPLVEVRKETADLLDGLTRNPARAVAVLTPIPAPGRPEKNALGLVPQNYRDAIGEEAEGRPQVAVIDGTALVSDRAEQFVDGVHPNDSGMREYAANLAAPLVPLLHGR